jgi:hypothetical protein
MLEIVLTIIGVGNPLTKLAARSQPIAHARVLVELFLRFVNAAADAPYRKHLYRRRKSVYLINGGG